MKNEEFQNNLYYDHNYSIKLFITIEKYKEIHQNIDIIDFGKKKLHISFILLVYLNMYYLIINILRHIKIYYLSFGRIS